MENIELKFYEEIEKKIRESKLKRSATADETNSTQKNINSEIITNETNFIINEDKKPLTFSDVELVEYNYFDWKKEKFNENNQLAKIDEKINIYKFDGGYCVEFWNGKEFKTTKEVNKIKFIELIKDFTGIEIKAADLEDLKSVVDIDYIPKLTNTTFYKLKEYKNAYTKNLFEPPKYLLANYNKKIEVEHFKAINSLCNNLVGNNSEYLNYFYNYLAYKIQNLDKRLTSCIVLLGSQGTGKGTFYNTIINPLFGAKNTVKIDANAINSGFLDIIANRQFIIIDELKKENIEKNMPLVKQFTAEGKVLLNKKHTDLKEYNLYSGTLIFSNDRDPLPLEDSDRRFTYFPTGKPLTQNNFLGYGTFNNLDTQIKKELLSFAMFLKQFAVDANLANNCLETPYKRGLLQEAKSDLQKYYEIIINKDINVIKEMLEDVQEDKEVFGNQNLINELLAGFLENKIIKTNIWKLFEKIFNEKKEFGNKSFWNALKKLDKEKNNIFEREIKGTDNKNNFYIINN